MLLDYEKMNYIMENYKLIKKWDEKVCEEINNNFI